MRPGEETVVSDLISTTFNDFIASGYSEKGKNEFLDYIQSKNFKKRSKSNHVILVVTKKNSKKIIGMVEIRNFAHISLWFVDKTYHKKGIGKMLMSTAIELCKEKKEDLKEISVNSSPNAARAYEKLGFKRKGEEKERNGIRFIEMGLKVN